VKGLKSGKGAGRGSLRDRVEKGGVGKRRVEEKDVRWVLGGKVGVVKKDEREEFLTDLVKGDRGWSNENVEILREGVVDVDMIGGEEEGEIRSVEDMLEESDELFKEIGEKGKEVEGLERSMHAGGQRRLEEIRRVYEGEKVWAEGGLKKKALVGERLFEMEEDEEIVDSMEEWKLRKLRREKREMEERKQREKEGIVNRGRELGRTREEVKALRKEFRDWKEEVDEIRYILGKSEEDAKGYAVDLEVKRWGKELRKMIGDVGKMVEDIRDGKVEVRSEVVVPEVVERVMEVEKKLAVVGGRTYGEVLKGVGGIKGVDERERVEEKVRVEREVAEKSLLEREERQGRMVEVILDSQGTEGEKSGKIGSWDSEKVEEELGLKKGDIKSVVGKKGKVFVEMKEGKGKELVKEMSEVKWERAIGSKVEEVKLRDSWVGMVIPAVEVGKWKGRMGEMRKDLEDRVGMVLMKDPVWLVNERRMESMRMSHVGVVVHVARESERVKWLEVGIMWEGMRIGLNRYVGRTEVEWCTKCASFGHSWWKCEGGKKCSVSGVKGHTGWEHRCGRCNVWRAPCVHYRKCGGCGGGHTMREASEGNCVAMRMEWGRLKSLC